MATSIRLARRGSKKRPYYWIVVADSRSPRDGAFIEKLGSYDPFSVDSNRANLDAERTRYWLSVGAQPTDRVASLLDKLAIRKKAQKFNPKKGEPKAKSKERMAEQQIIRESSVTAREFNEEEREKARSRIKVFVSDSIETALANRASSIDT